ncbi:hypothetical protein LCGC14_2618060 [marine sediment metagenome]|uniref:Restriction alleviation protein, Lar family n=1 Tax=marine sediment metagenome TaxID=412755 RepID=A0A0F9CEZ8_9ZZZZ
MKAKPCPFCGCTDVTTPPGIAIAICEHCEAAGPPAKEYSGSDTLTIASAVAKWNERHEQNISILVQNLFNAYENAIPRLTFGMSVTTFLINSGQG